MHVVVLAGGTGGARFLRGLLHAVPEAQITVVGNTADDITLVGLRVCPDLDTIMYTLGGGIQEEQGWGRADETFTVSGELAAYGAGPGWFTLGDRDIATHLVRTEMLGAGYRLSEVTAALCARWLGPPHRSRLRLLPMTDDRVETQVVIDDRGPTDRQGPAEPNGPAEPHGPGRRAIHFQEWWLRFRAQVPARAIHPAGAAEARPAPGVTEAIEAADLALLPPSNPVVSIGTILAVPGIRAALEPKTVVGVSPIIGGAPLRGMADACLAAIGVETSAEAVARHYGPALLDGWLVDPVDNTHGTDRGAGGRAGAGGVAVRSLPLYMRDLETASAIAGAALELGRELQR